MPKFWQIKTFGGREFEPPAPAPLDGIKNSRCECCCTPAWYCKTLEHNTFWAFSKWRLEYGPAWFRFCINWILYIDPFLTNFLIQKAWSYIIYVITPFVIFQERRFSNLIWTYRRASNLCHKHTVGFQICVIQIFFRCFLSCLGKLFMFL